MFVHCNHRDNFILEGFFGEFSKSAYVKNLYEYTHGAIDDGVNWTLAELELVAVAEGARPFVQATYCLEGDGLCIVYVYDRILWPHTP